MPAYNKVAISLGILYLLLDSFLSLTNIACVTNSHALAAEGYIKCMAAGTVEDPFASYDTCMVLWPKSNNVLETKNMGKQSNKPMTKRLWKSFQLQ